MDNNHKEPIDISSRLNSRWAVTVSMDIINEPVSMMAVLQLPAGIVGDAAMEWARAALKCWSNGTPYPTPDHKAFAMAVDEMHLALASKLLGANIGGLIDPEQLQILKTMVDTNQNGLTGRVM